MPFRALGAAFLSLEAANAREGIKTKDVAYTSSSHLMATLEAANAREGIKTEAAGRLPFWGIDG